MVLVYVVAGAICALAGGAVASVPIGLVLHNGASLLWLIPIGALFGAGGVVSAGLMFAPP